MKEITVLGNSFVNYVDHFGSDSRIVDAARVSYLDSSKGPEKDKKLLRYLFKNKHTSPFEQVNITFSIRMPIFVMRQFVRQRTFRLNEVSARYTELDLGFYIPEKWRKQDTKNKQSSVSGDLAYSDRYISTDLKTHCEDCFAKYKQFLAMGMAREMARMVLPLNTLTEIIVNADMSNLIKYFMTRDENHAQWEHQEIARAMQEITFECFPWTMEMYEDLKREASTG